jgi:light-regulated signal transduction histidine kinase (bacteriophytochrome)
MEIIIDHIKGDEGPEPKNMTTEVNKKEYTEFIDLATHDLDAPLRKLTTLFEMMVSKFSNIGSDEELQRYVHRIGACIQDMRSLIDDLSRLSRLAADKSKYTPCDLSSIIQKVRADLHTLINEKKVIISVSNLPVVEGQAEQYQQLFRLLIENSIKFNQFSVTPEIQIESSILSQEEKAALDLPSERAYHKIEIADNGIGFKQEYAEKIFQPFVRLHGKARYPGNGISLAICKKIVENHQGVIYGEGEEEKGARFILVLPERN